MAAEPTPEIEVARAIEVFARGWSVTRSRTHPYLPERIGPAWVMRDAPRPGKTPKYRREEWIVRAADADAVVDLAELHARSRYAICVVRSMDEPAGPVRQAYKEKGLRLGATEPLMIHPLARIPRSPTSYTITRVKTAQLLEQVADVRRMRPQTDVLDPASPIRQYVALDRSEPVGWAESIVVTAESGDRFTWCSNMYVAEGHRRRGIARSLLSLMLRDDRQRGSQASVLLASHAGAQLYPVVGYQQIGELLLYTPRPAGVPR